MNASLTEAEIWTFLHAVEIGEIVLTAVNNPQEVYTGAVVYLASNRWSITVRIEENDWQYIDGLSAADGRDSRYQNIRECAYLKIAGIPHIFETYRPSEAVAWVRYGLPGWGSFQCVECGEDLSENDYIHRPAFHCIECGPLCSDPHDSDI